MIPREKTTIRGMKIEMRLMGGSNTKDEAEREKEWRKESDTPAQRRKPAKYKRGALS